MAKIQPFEEYTSEYENWFNENQYVYQSEINAIKRLLPKQKNGIEIGIGSGRFAEPLGIKIGIEPSEKMASIAIRKNINVIKGVAEKLPLYNQQFDFVLMVTTICFVDNVENSFKEVYRILKPNGEFLIAFIDRESPIGRIYEKYKEQNVFYKFATFYTVKELTTILEKVGFNNFEYTQTIFHNLDKIKNIEEVKSGYGEGSFVVIKAIK